jgi:putative ABC transport system permease protein
MAVFHWTLRALLSHWRRHPVQFFSVLTGLWLATALLVGVQALNSQARDSYARASQLIGGEPQASLGTPDGASFAQDVFAQLRRAGWPVSPVVQGRVQLEGQPDVRLQLMGIDPVSLPGSGAVAGQRLSQAQMLAFFDPPGRTWIAPQTLQALGLHEGQQPTTLSGHTLPPLQIQADMAPGLLLTDIGFAQPVLEMPGRLSRLLVDKAFAAGQPTAPAGLQLKQGEDNNLARLTESFHLNLDALGFLSFVVGLFIVHAAIGLALEQRRGLLRTLRACGVSVRMLIASLSVELGALSLLGGVLGVASGYLLASLLLPIRIGLAASAKAGAAVPRVMLTANKHRVFGSIFMAWFSVLFLLLEQMLSLTFCQKLTSKFGRRKGPLVGRDRNVGAGLLANAMSQSPNGVPDTPFSRASPLPH